MRTSMFAVVFLACTTPYLSVRTAPTLNNTKVHHPVQVNLDDLHSAAEACDDCHNFYTQAGDGHTGSNVGAFQLSLAVFVLCLFLLHRSHFSTTERRTSKAVYYSFYIGVPQLLSVLNPVTCEPEEARFIRVHQVAEILFAQTLDDLDQLRRFLLIVINRSGSESQSDASDSSESKHTNLYDFSDLVTKTIVLARKAQRSLELIAGDIHYLKEAMTAEEFGRFRGKLGTASGLQSLQFRKLEWVFGFEPAQKAWDALSAADVADLRMFIENNPNSIGRVVESTNAGNFPVPIQKALVDLAGGLSGVREAHLALVLSMIGDCAGTGKTGGASYLRRVITERVAFPALTRIVTGETRTEYLCKGAIEECQEERVSCPVTGQLGRCSWSADA